MVAGVKRVEKFVNFYVGKPLSWAIYVAWLMLKHGYRLVVQGLMWLRSRFAVVANKA